MRDIATLKERVDHAERHLKATETARNRESETLMDTWRKIRERFTHQEGEIARYRAEVESLAVVDPFLEHCDVPHGASILLENPGTASVGAVDNPLT